MTTAHRPTFDTARGRSSQAPTRINHSRMLPAHTQLKYRKRGQGGAADRADLSTLPASDERRWEREAMKKELLAREEENDKAKGRVKKLTETLMIEGGADDENNVNEEDEDRKTKRRKMIMEEVRKNEGESDDENDSNSDASSTHSSSEDSDDSQDEDSEESDEDEEDETAELMRELARIKKERADERAKQERVRQESEQADREDEMSKGNPLLSFNDGFLSRGKSTKRWDEDVVFKNQAKGMDGKGKGDFINDMLRSDFHKKFMNKYIR
ncbi:Pre-mRNA-splicing factor Cwf15/Cwc15 [Lipomyces arxii]|uniref:Pre-mRNA-splicing factor Cwf15/Cwc15 n=1 Tax=Lipomyces arxii TaxID=56418 RepID=UPI0034D00F06